MPGQYRPDRRRRGDVGSEVVSQRPTLRLPVSALLPTVLTTLERAADEPRLA